MSSTPRFDCELPPEVRAELLPPRRPRILKVTLPVRRPKHPWFFIAVAFAIPAALVVAVSLSDLRYRLAPPLPASTPAPTHLETPEVVTSPNDKRFFPSEVRRTKYLHQIQMPYGETLIAHYLGDLPDQEALPQTGNHIGDEYSIGSYRFVWVAPYGADVGHWIDP
jgi:hypothetical protein